MPIGLIDVNIGLGNALLQSGNKPMLFRITDKPWVSQSEYINHGLPILSKAGKIRMSSKK